MEEKREGEPGVPAQEDIVEEEGLISGDLFPKRGCLKGCLTPIVVILIAMLAIALLGYMKQGAFRRWIAQGIISNTQKQVLTDLPEGTDENTVKEAFEEVKTAIEEGKINEKAMRDAINEYLDAMNSMPSKEEKKREIDKLLTNLKAAIVMEEKK